MSFLDSAETHSGTLECESGCTYESLLANLTPKGEGRALTWARANAVPKKAFNLWVEWLLLSQLLLLHLKTHSQRLFRKLFSSLGEPMLQEN